MLGGTGDVVFSTFTPKKVVLAAAWLACCGRKAMPSKLKFAAAVSAKAVEMNPPVTTFDQVAVIRIVLNAVRCRLNCNVYDVPSAKPVKMLLEIEFAPSVVQSPVVPSSDVSVK